MAPTAIDCTVDGSDSARGESGALGFEMLSVSQAPAQTSTVARPTTSGIRLVKLMSRKLLEKVGPRGQKLISAKPVKVRKFGYEKPSTRNEYGSPDRPATSGSYPEYLVKVNRLRPITPTRRLLIPRPSFSSRLRWNV